MLRRAVAELSWLLSRGYGETAALKLVGDRHGLRVRQRRAILGAACGDAQLERRLQHRMCASELDGRALALDGFNVLIVAESALSGGLVLRGRDGCHRDLASVHGSYRSVQETELAVDLLGQVLAQLRVASVTWYLDRPVSNSGRLKQRLLDVAQRRGWPWAVELDHNPDRELAETEAVVASSDGWVLDRCARWTDLVGAVIGSRVPEAWVLDLAVADEK